MGAIVKHAFDIVLYTICTILNFIFTLLNKLVKKKTSMSYSSFVIVITGCDSGFGEICAHQFTKLGFHVVAGCLTSNGVSNLKGKVALPLLLNVTKQNEINEFVLETEKYCNLKKLKIWALINNAGIASGGCVDWVPMDSYRLIMEINFFGLVAVTKAFLPMLKGTKNSRIIMLSSVAGLISAPNTTAYSASKHAVEAFAKGLRAELRPWNIHVSNINPGFMR